MKEELMTEVMQQMLSYLDNAQMKQLKQVMDHILFRYEVTVTEIEPDEDDRQYTKNPIQLLFLAGGRRLHY